VAEHQVMFPFVKGHNSSSSDFVSHQDDQDDQDFYSNGFFAGSISTLLKEGHAKTERRKRTALCSVAHRVLQVAFLWLLLKNQKQYKVTILMDHNSQ
jgi:hypothetical protein